MRWPVLIFTLLLAVCVSLATITERHQHNRIQRHARTSGFLETLMGDSRRLFATHVLLKADAYFHSGFYPSIFDNPKGFEEAHLGDTSSEEHAEQPAKTPPPEQGHDHHHGHDDHDHGHGDHGHDHDGNCFVEKREDWISRFSRHFAPSAHTHLDSAASAEHPGGAREILPWLKLAAQLDPNRVETYTLAGYWLRTRLGKTSEAESFLRDGLRANPGDPSILFELGRICADAKHDPVAARNLWELALQKWREREFPKEKPDAMLLSQIVLHLANLEEAAENYQAALAYWTLAKPISPHPEEVEKRIAEVRAKQAAANQP